MKYQSPLIAFSLLLVLCSISGADAECMGDASPLCQAFWRAQVVFSYPSAGDVSGAKIFALKAGEKLTGVDFTLPRPLTSRNIEGIVVWPDGRPVSQAGLNVMITDYSYGMGYGVARSDDTGHFSFTLFAGLSYWVNPLASLPGGKQVHSEPIDVPGEGNFKDLRLVVESPSGSCERCRFRHGPYKKP